ncbi:hypothetical protein BDW60DRAFT_195155 [Aspergillus nidulans var. acristatus]
MAPTRPYLPPLSTPKTMIFPSELRDPDPVSYTCLDSAKSVKSEDFSSETETSITPPSAYTEFLNTFSPIFASPSTSRANFSKYMLDKPRPSPSSAPPSALSFSSRPGYQHSGRHGHGYGHGHRRNNSNGSGNSMKHTHTIPSPRCTKSQSPIKNINLSLGQTYQTQDHARRLRQSQGAGAGQLYTPVTPSPLSASAYCHSHPHTYPHRPPFSEWRFHQLESPATSTDESSYNLRQIVTTTITFRVAPRLADPPAGKKKRSAGVRKNP